MNKIKTMIPISKELKKRLRKFCIKNDVTYEYAIKRALNYLEGW